MKGLSVVLLVLAADLALVRHVCGQKGSTLAGYTFESDVSEHAKLDLDQQEMEKLTDEFKWSEATSIYAAGKNSEKSDSLRTLKGFSSEAPGKLDGEGYWELYKEYYGAGDYADKFITGALSGNGDFGGKPNIFRAECANKGSQYQSVWMYVIHEMEDAINDCNNNDLTDNDKGVKAWDEAWAFYTGSREGTDGSGSGTMLYELAQKRCVNFGTCGEGADAPVNTKVLNALKAGRQNLNGGDCDGALKQKNEIVKQMTIPVIQGTLRYVDLTKDAVDADPESEEVHKPHAEGLAFARAFLPILDNCDGGDAKTVAENFAIDADPPMKDDKDKVSKAIFDNLGCMGLSCDDIGVLDGADLPECSTSGDFKVVKGTDASAASNLENGVFGESGGSSDSGSSSSGSSSTSKSSSGGLSGGVIAGIVIGGLVILGIVAAFLFLRFKKNKKMSPLVPPPQEGEQTFV